MNSTHEAQINSALVQHSLPNTDLIRDNGAKLLDAIDGLRKLGVDKDIPLPQIIVVGSQSAGKSSVLEAIAGIAFPVNDGQCTTFATEIRMRRSKVGPESIALNIVSRTSDQPGEETIRPLNAPNSTGNASDEAMSWSQIPKIIQQATDAMSKGQGQQFFDEVLRIEISGPTQDHLSLIDLPGIFHALKPDQDPTSPQRVKDTVLRYMKEKRSIILAVVSAKDNFSNQEILRTVEDIDPNGLRTMGIITGIDTIPKGSASEDDYIKLARNELKPFALGWHVVRNLSFEERKDPHADRDAIEKAFFSNNTAWNTVPERDCGVPQLKKKLSETLLVHIGKELGGVISALEQKIIDNERVLEQLGPERATASEKRGYLTQLAMSLRNLSKEALEGPYEDEFFTITGQRLRAQLEAEYDLFERDITTRGHRWDFWTLRSGFLMHHPSAQIGDDHSSDNGKLPYQVHRDIYLAKVDKVLVQQRGPELPGRCNPRLIKTLFKDQAYRWESIARSAIGKVVSLLKLFLNSVTVHVVEQRRARILLHKKLWPALQEREQAVYKKLEELLKPFQKCHPITRDPRFRTSFQAPERQQGSFEGSEAASGTPQDNLKDPFDSEKLTIDMQSYYEIARATFVDNVLGLAIEMCLLDGFADILSPVTVSSMPDEEVAELVSEFVDDTIQRQKAHYALKTLRDGLEICREHDRRDLEPLIPEPALTGPAQLGRINPPSPKQSPARGLFSAGNTTTIKQNGTTFIPPRANGTATPQQVPAKGTTSNIFGTVASSASPQSSAATPATGGTGLFGAPQPAARPAETNDAPSTAKTTVQKNGFGGFGSTAFDAASAQKGSAPFSSTNGGIFGTQATFRS